MASLDDLSQVHAVVRGTTSVTRTELFAELGWSRVTVRRRIDELVAAGILESVGARRSTGGRPPQSLGLRPGFGVLLAADIGGSETRVAVCDFSGHIESARSVALDVAQGPDVVLPRVRALFDTLLGQTGHTFREVLGVGVGVPGPVDFAAGRLVRPPIMPGWDGVSPAAGLFPENPDVPVLVDHDANLLALGEYGRGRPDARDFILVKLGQGLGLSLVIEGAVWRGGTGMAGELGHMRIEEGGACRCGRHGCLESIAGGWAIGRRLREAGHQVTTSDDVVDLALGGNQLATDSLSGAGALIGEALVNVVGLVNPTTIVVAGNLARAGELLMAPIRDALEAGVPDYLRGTFVLEHSRLGVDAGVTGAALLALEAVCSPTYLQRHVCVHE